MADNTEPIKSVVAPDIDPAGGGIVTDEQTGGLLLTSNPSGHLPRRRPQC